MARTATEKTLAIVRDGEAPVRTSKLPPLIRFPLLLLLNLTLSALLYSFVAPFIGGELASVSPSGYSWKEAWGLIFVRGIELAIGWWGGYDGYDIAALTVLSHGPALYLLNTFYQLRTSTVTASLVIDIIANYIPFRLLRPLSRAHAGKQVPNTDIVSDFSVQAFTTLLAGSIYSVVIYSAYATYLPVYLATYYTGLPSLVAAYSSSPISLLPLCILLGVATKSFIFTPAAAIAADKKTAFVPSKATLGETFWYNLWGFDNKTKTAIKRTAGLVLVSGGNTFVQTWVTVEGVEVLGAVAYAAVWAVAGAIAGGALGVVGAV